MRTSREVHERLRSSSAPSGWSQRLSGAMSLVDVTCQLAAQHDEEAVLRLVTETVCEALDCERATLFLADESGRELTTRVVTELEISEIRIAFGTGVAGWVAEHREVANIPDPPLDSRWNGAIDRATGFRTQSLLAAPLISIHDGRLIGVLQLLNRRSGVFDEFDEKLIQAFASHAATAIERGRLMEKARKSQAMQLALEMSRSIQTGFLPRQLPAIPGYDLAAWWQPAEEVSGDYYDVIPLPDGRIGLIVADVSGHGIGPSLIMASVRAMLRVLCQTASNPSDILRTLARSITPDLQEGHFITLFFAALDPVTHEVIFSNAGHGPALCRRHDTGGFEVLRSTTWPIGFEASAPHDSDGQLTMAPGDTLILATDGAIELRDAERRMFGRPRLEACISSAADGTADGMIAQMRGAIGEFLQGRLPPDDITALVVKRARS